MNDNLDEWVKGFSYPVLKQKYDDEITRATGRSTRLADNYIQELFNNQDTWITIKDHFNSNNAARMLSNTIVKRLKFEHGDSIDIKEQLSPYGFPTLKLTCVKKRNDDIIEAMKRELDRRDNLSKQSDNDRINNIVDTWANDNNIAVKVVDDLSVDTITGDWYIRNNDIVCDGVIARVNNDCISVSSDGVVNVIDKMEDEINELKDKLNNQNKFVLEKQKDANIEFNIFK